MTRKTGFIFLAFVLLISLLGLCAGIYFYNDSQEPRSFQEYLNQWRVKNSISSVIVSEKDLNTGKMIVYTSGNQIMGKNSPINQNILYGVGSISKTFVSAVLLELQEEGKLNLDNQLAQYFPEYSKWSGISIRQLLNMTSGIPNPNLSKIAPNQLISEQDLIKTAYDQDLLFKPGSSWSYSNTNYFLAGLIIEKITHENLNQVYQERFFTPLKLSHSFYSDDFYSQNIQDQMAHIYIHGKDATNFNASFLGSAGSVLMSNQDLLTWTQDLLVSGKILNTESMAEFLKTTAIANPAPRPEGSRYGLGIFWTKFKNRKDKNIGPIWWYTGVITGYTSIFMYLPQEHQIITAQVASWPLDNYAILFPNQDLMQRVLRSGLEHE